MMQRLKAITEDTLLPISLVITLIGGVLWLSSIHSSVAETGRRVEKLEEKQATLERIDRRLSRIEGKMGILNE